MKYWETLKFIRIRNMIVTLLVLIISLMAFERATAQDLVLENEYLHIELEQNWPYVKQYLLKANNEVIYGDIVNEMFHAHILYQNNYFDVEPSIFDITQTSDRICYHIQTEINSMPAVNFDLCYILDGSTVQVVFSNVFEMPNFKLLYVRSPNLITIRGTQPGAKLIFPHAEGRLIDIATANPGWEVIDLGYTGWLRPLLISMLYHDGLAGIVSYDHLDMMLYSLVFDHSSQGRLCSVGMRFNYRYAPTNFSTATFIDVFDSETTSLAVNLIFTDDYDGDQDIDWMDGAKVLREQVNAMPESNYLSSFITKIGRTGIGHISEHLENIEKLYHLTDHNKIYGYLLDYNHKIFEVFGVEEDIDPSFASLEELNEAFRTAEESFNTFLGFHDVYSDYYPGTPGYDPVLRVIQDDGTPYPGWPLPDFPEAFQTDPFDYAMQEGLDRVKKTLTRYPIRESHHLDVLSLLFHRDYSLDSPSSREKNRRGLQLIIDEFNEYGIDVTSEGLTGQMVESGIGWFLDTPRFFSTTLSFGNEELIPLIEFIFHGKTLYGLYEDIYYDQLPSEQVPIYTFLEPLLLGANSAAHITYTGEDDLEIDKFYLIDLPWMALNQRFMEDYEASGNYRKITYDASTFVEIDYESNTYTVQVDGRVIGRNYTTFFPKDENTFLIYSRDAKTLSEPLPKEWSKNVILMELTQEGIGDSVLFEIIKGTIVFDVKANTPYKLIHMPLGLVPDIKANGLDGPLFVTPSESVDISISLAPGDKAGEWADWWGILVSSYGTFPLFGFQSPLFELPETSLFSSPWPMGWYIFVFGLDDTPDGAFELDWYDYVVVVSQPAGAQIENIPNFDDIVKKNLRELIGE